MLFAGGQGTGSKLGKKTAALLLALVMCSVHMRKASSAEDDVAVSSIEACPKPSGDVNHDDVCNDCPLIKLPEAVSTFVMKYCV